VMGLPAGSAVPLPMLPSSGVECDPAKLEARIDWSVLRPLDDQLHVEYTTTAFNDYLDIAATHAAMLATRAGSEGTEAPLTPPSFTISSPPLPLPPSPPPPPAPPPPLQPPPSPPPLTPPPTSLPLMTLATPLVLLPLALLLLAVPGVQSGVRYSVRHGVQHGVQHGVRLGVRHVHGWLSESRPVGAAAEAESDGRTRAAGAEYKQCSNAPDRDGEPDHNGIEMEGDEDYSSVWEHAARLDHRRDSASRYGHQLDPATYGQVC